MKIELSSNVTIDQDELSMNAILAQGKGGQNVNKVSTAIHLRFDIKASSLPEFYKTQLLAVRDRRISKDGVLVLKAQRFRSQEKNRDDAIERFVELVKASVKTQKHRTATKPTRSAKRRRVDDKTRRGKIKVLRKNNHRDD